MDTTLLIAIGGWLVTLTVCFLQITAGNKKIEKEQADQLKEITNTQEKHLIEIQASFNQAVAVINCEIQALSDRVEKHNNVVERTYKLESDVKVINEKFNGVNDKLNDLEKGDK